MPVKEDPVSDAIPARPPFRPSALLEQNAAAIRELATHHHISLVRVFGSAVKGTDTAASDIDLLVTPDEEASLFDPSGFRIAVEELTGYPVDVLSDGPTESEVMHRIRAESVPL